jgi:hypothetical protein
MTASHQRAHRHLSVCSAPRLAAPFSERHPSASGSEHHGDGNFSYTEVDRAGRLDEDPAVDHVTDRLPRRLGGLTLALSDRPQQDRVTDRVPVHQRQLLAGPRPRELSKRLRITGATGLIK